MVKRFGEREIRHLYIFCILGGGNGGVTLNFNCADTIILMSVDEITQTGTSE